MKCKICNNDQDYKRLSSHISRAHNMTYKDYLLKYKYNGTVPKCKCGCGEDTEFTKSQGMSFNDFIYGHYINVRPPLSEATRKSIGEKNSKNMKAYFKNNPEEAKKKGIQIRAGITEESNLKRIALMKETYATMTKEEKKRFSDHSISLWENDRDKMDIARTKAAETWKERYDNGEYDFTERNKKISKAISDLYINGGQDWARGNYTSTKVNRTFYYRSSWELLYMKELDEDSNVVKWDYEPFSLKYFDGEKQRRYIPDFIVETENTKLLVEVKPISLQHHGINKLKKEAALEWCKENNYQYTEVNYE